MISEGFKLSDFGGGPDHKSKFYPSCMYWRPEIFCMQACKLHMVSLGSIPMMCFAPKKLPKTQRLWLGLGLPPGPVEHKKCSWFDN